MNEFKDKIIISLLPYTLKGYCKKKNLNNQFKILKDILKDARFP